MTTEPQEPAAMPERGGRHMGPPGAARHVLPDLPISQGAAGPAGSGGPDLPSSSPLSASAPSDAARASRQVRRRPVQTFKTVRPIRVVDMTDPSADAAAALPALHDLGSAAPAPSATSSPTGIIQEVPQPSPVIEDVPWTGSGSSGASAGSGTSAPSAASASSARAASAPRRGRSSFSAVSAAVAAVLSARSAGSAGTSGSAASAGTPRSAGSAGTTGSAASAASGLSAPSAVSAASAPAAPTRRARRKGRHAAEAEAVTRPVPLASLGIPDDAFSSVRSPATPASPRSLTGSPLSPAPTATPSPSEPPIITSTPLDSPESGRRAAVPIEDWSEGSDATVHALTGSMARSLSAEATPTHLRLVPLTGGQAIALNDIALVGRAPENISRYNAAEAIRLADSSRTVSKTHACIVPMANGAWISDLHSTNGTRVIMDGVLTRLLPDVPVPVLPGTTIYFGSIGFVLES
ncbi:FHA domain-containing protein [Actinomyces sp. zg328]|uniref:FHA domain-containing protein n=1 Tax=Actinomyces sp. zg328 TaxID=2609287 RepID=UPI00135986BE|nr:FHA domain-containing protein [Actinomyces sp. zg328]